MDHLCIVMDYEDKRETLADINMSLESDIPFDILLYSTAVWNENVSKEGSFANKIFKEGRMIYG